VDTNETVTNVDFAFTASGSYDYGDLPEGAITLNGDSVTANYSTTLTGTPDGARHAMPTTGGYTTYLGATAPDTEVNGAPGVAATGDGSDENGIFIPVGDTLDPSNYNDSWTADNGAMINVTVTGSGWLVGWIDLNGNGVFGDAGETIVDQEISSTTDGDIILPNFKVPSDGIYYTRFRIFKIEPAVAEISFAGAATDGEVEDYRFSVNGGVPTPVTVSRFIAQRQGSQVAFEWSTSTESANVGFNLYVQPDEGEPIRINNKLIPSRVIDSLSQQNYAEKFDVGGNIFYIEDVSLFGETRMHGPFNLGQEYGELLEEELIDHEAINAEHAQKEAARNEAAKLNMKIPAEALYTAARTATSASSNLQLNNTLNLKVNKTGVYRVTYEEIKAAGLNLTGVPASKIAISNRGNIIQSYVYTPSTSRSGAKFGAGSYIEFYGKALDTIYTDTNIYVLQVTKTAASRVTVASAAPPRRVAPVAVFTDTVTVNNQKTYAKYAPGVDAWYDTALQSNSSNEMSSEFKFQVTGLSPAAGLPKSLTLTVWGISDWAVTPDHHMLISVNGVTVADERFDGLVEKTFKISLPDGILKEGENTIRLTAAKVEDASIPYDGIALDKFSISYPRIFQAKDGQLTFTASGKSFTVANLPNANVVVYRVNSRGNVARLSRLSIIKSGNAFSASFAGLTQTATYIVSTTDKLLAPALEPTRLAVNLNQRAQYLIISHPDFIEGLQPLVQARQAQGLTVSVVNVQDLYAKYTHGIFDPQAIKTYIAYAKQSLGAQYILLVGGDTYDYRNYLSYNNISFIPSLYISTNNVAKFVPADPLYADVNNDRIPDIAIGRFPVRTTAELTLMVNKTLAYQAKDYSKTATFVSDYADNVVSFKDMSNLIALGAPDDWAVEHIHMDDIGVAAARTQVFTAMNRGESLITYTGHSGPQKWTTSGLFKFSDVKSLTNADRPFVTVQWGCWNTYYVDPVYKYMVQSFLFSGNNGAAAVLGASTLTDSKSEEMLGILLTPRLTTPGKPIGIALQEAKYELAKSNPKLLDVILGWSLMGDPALVIQQ
jgi:hypothetical protein